MGDAPSSPVLWYINVTTFGIFRRSEDLLSGFFDFAHLHCASSHYRYFWSQAGSLLANVRCSLQSAVTLLSYTRQASFVTGISNSCAIVIARCCSIKHA